MTIYILPTGPNQLPKEYFEGKGMSFRPYDGGSPNMLFWNEFYRECEKRGIKILSYTEWRKTDSNQKDALLVLNHPSETLIWRIFYSLKHRSDGGGFVLKRRKFFIENHPFFKRRILIQLEPFVVTPHFYKHLGKIANSGFYDKIFCTTRIGKFGVEYFNFFESRTKDITSSYFNAPKTKYLTIINSNARPHSLRNELYGERLKAIKFFSAIKGFDLYGFDWDKTPRHPFYFHYGKYVRRSWRGQIPDKLKVMSEYKFSIVFENDINPGWISEKIFDALAAGSIPVYLGAPDIEKAVPSDCFIDFRKFGDYQKLHDFLMSLSEREISAYRERISKFLRFSHDSRAMEKFVDMATENDIVIR